jgi:hypothetical protein
MAIGQQAITKITANDWPSYNPYDRKRILNLSEGSYVDNMAFANERAAVQYLINYLYTRERDYCKTMEDVIQFRKSCGIHLFQIVDA